MSSYLPAMSDLIGQGADPEALSSANNSIATGIASPSMPSGSGGAGYAMPATQMQASAPPPPSPAAMNAAAIASQNTQGSTGAPDLQQTKQSSNPLQGLLGGGGAAPDPYAWKPANLQQAQLGSVSPQYPGLSSAFGR